MANPGHTDEALRETVAQWIDANKCAAEAARRNGIVEQTFKARLKRAAEKGFVDRSPAMPGFVIKSVSTTLKDGVVEREHIKQVEEPGVPFVLPEGHRIKGISANVDSEGRVTSQWIKTREDQLSLETIYEQIKDALADYEGRAPAMARPDHTDDDLATVYIAADWHVGLLSWKEETGHNYDLKIAQRTIEGAMSRLIAGTPSSKQAVVLGLGDLLHADNYENTTSRSKNRLDVDGRYPRVLYAATQVLIYTIDLALRKHERVLVRILPGNHDDQSAIAVTLALAMFFRNEDRVTVDDDPGAFWWWSWGKVLLGATHGDQAKMKDLPLTMAARNAEAWGSSKFRHIYTGHIHTATGIELSGVTVESFQTPAAPDAWHSRMGYGANRSVCAVTHHKEGGEICRNKVNIL